MLVWRLARVDTAATWWTAALAGLYPVRWTGMDYTIRKSRRARRVWLHLNEAGELVVVVPQGFDVRKVEGIVESHREWIARAGSRMSLQRLETGRTKVAALPSRVVLPA
ncbi:MAG: hypothetical protein JXA58_01375, partial [Dehalococcoidia bacterium]|nr:hypothetical protein [Dehalococcoidia bacterium]